MKHILFLSVIGLSFFSCKKSISDTTLMSLEGTWKMVLVTDNTTGVTETKPSSIQGDVIITFVPDNDSTGTFSGKTPTNEITKNDYLLGLNQTLSILSLGMSQVMETSWGSEFVNNIISAEQYSFITREKLVIKTTDKMLTFKKI